MAANPLDWFPFNAQDYLTDPSVLMMSAEAEGCYVRLLMRSWVSPSPGMIPASLIPEMSALYRVPEADRPRVLSEVVRAFEESSTGWVQKRMVAEYAEAVAKHVARRRGAETTNRIRWGSSLSDRSASRKRVAPVSHSGRYARVDSKTLGVGVDSTETDKAEALEPSTNGVGKAEALEQAPGLEGIAEETPAQWRAGFDDFWKEYPRKVKREEALKAYMKLRPYIQSTYDALFAGLEHWKRGEWEKREIDKVEHCSTWLNNRRYLDAQATR